MIKTFKYKKLEVKVKTNQTKAGIAYYGEKDILASVEEVYKKVDYANGHGCPEDIFVVEVFKALKSQGIAAFEVVMGNVAYRGVKLTETSTQKKLDDLVD